MGEIVTLSEVLGARSSGVTIAFISGKFNVVHPGHLRLFRFAKEISDVLVVGVFADGTAPDILLPESERLDGVAAINSVDYAVVLNSSVDEVIRSLKPDCVVKGREHEERHNPEYAELERYGGVIHFVSGDTRISAAALLRSEFSETRALIQHAKEYLNRRGIDRSKLSETVKKMAEIRSIVIGDLIIDEYLDCQPLGLSAEDPTVVVTPLHSNQFLGGAGIVASHAASLGGAASFISVSGEDDAHQWAKDRLEDFGIETFLFSDSSRPTTKKTRYRAEGKTLLRLNQVRDHLISREIQQKISTQFRQELGDADVVIFSDFGYGLFSDEFTESLIKTGASGNLVMSADSQSSSQIGDLSQFRGLTLLTPTEKEARLAVRDRHGGLVQVAHSLKQATDADNVIITLASEGVFMHAQRVGEDSWDDDQIPALNRNPKDVAGAGDAFLVGATLALAAKADIWVAAYVGSLAAALQVNQVGNLPLSSEDLLQVINQ